MLQEVLVALRASEGGRSYLDATYGGGGHTQALLDAHPGNTVTALDCDPEAGERAAAMQAVTAGDRFKFHRINFEGLDSVVAGPFDGVLFDLGLSSFHYDTPERGFSFRFGAEADMRLDTEAGMTAAQFLEMAPQAELVRAVRDYGEEPSWRRVVGAILAARGSGRLQRTDSLAELIEANASHGPRGRRMKIHPATRVFQGIRIAVNRELEVLEAALPKAFEVLAPGGRLVVISFHSLEDRIVKRFFRRMAGQPEHRFDARALQDRQVRARIVTPRPLVPTEDEIRDNPRARSSRMRVLEKEIKA